jgi:hypothetical protein
MNFNYFWKLPIVLLILASCDADMHAKKGGKVNHLEGEWNAVWEIDDSVSDPLTTQMTGKWKFSEDIVELQAFGFEGCAFGADSISNLMNFQLANQSILLNNVEGDLLLEYSILQVSPGRVELGFLDDIKIILTKVD